MVFISPYHHFNINMKKHLLCLALLIMPATILIAAHNPGKKKSIGSTIAVSQNFTQSDADNLSWPIILTGGTFAIPVVVTLTENITLDDVGEYFQIQSDYIVFNGDDKTITLQSITAYPGLFVNSDGNTSGYSTVTIKNIRIHSDLSSLQSGNGWIGQQYFCLLANNDTIANCSSDGNISPSGGGITGSNSEVVVINSHSTGAIGDFGGGISGESGSNKIIKCYSTGNIGSYGGGISGYGASVQVTNCYSTGNIGVFSGGIFGYAASGAVTGSYSNGLIAQYGGGITGSYSSSTIKNCFSTGLIGTEAGGISGYGSYGTVDSCYTIGILLTAAGGIIEPNSNTTVSNSYSEQTGVWNDGNTIGILNNINTDTWTDIDLNTDEIPYRLSTFDSVFYTPTIESKLPGLLLNSPAADFSNGLYSLISINNATLNTYPSISFDPATGILTYASTPLGTYVSKVIYMNLADNSYEISSYTLNVVSVLPVTWQSFTVNARGKEAWLQWSTASEQNTRDFEIQHSTDGISWTAIGRLDAGGNTVVETSYSFLHSDPVNGINYYRLKQFDIDGKFSFSNIQVLKLTDAIKNFSLVTNVIENGSIRILVKTAGTLQLYGSNGKLIIQKQYGTGLQLMDVSGLSKGVYFLKGTTQVEKILVR